MFLVIINYCVFIFSTQKPHFMKEQSSGACQMATQSLWIMSTMTIVTVTMDLMNQVCLEYVCEGIFSVVKIVYVVRWVIVNWLLFTTLILTFPFLKQFLFLIRKWSTYRAGESAKRLTRLLEVKLWNDFLGLVYILALPHDIALIQTLGNFPFLLQNNSFPNRVSLCLPHKSSPEVFCKFDYNLITLINWYKVSYIY